MYRPPRLDSIVMVSLRGRERPLTLGGRVLRLIVRAVQGQAQMRSGCGHEPPGGRGRGWPRRWLCLPNSLASTGTSARLSAWSLADRVVLNSDPLGRPRGWTRGRPNQIARDRGGFRVQ